MERLEADWQGFQTFNEEYVIPPKYIAQIQQQSVQQVKHQDQCRLQEKKMTLRSKNKRKFSYFHINNIKKPMNQSLIQKATPIISSIQQKSKINHSFAQKKPQGIPIFRQLAHPCIGKLIYKGNHFQTAEQYLTRNKLEDYQPNNQGDLIFNSKFESGNLEQVVKHNQQYHLYIAVDTNTKGHRQWYFFTVSSHKTFRAKFIIHSFKKRLSLYQTGMRPYGKKISQSYEEWKPIGTNIRYFRANATSSKIKNLKKSPEFHLSFQIELEKDVQISLASCIPYSYSFLRQRINMYRQPSCKIKINSSILCKSLTGMQVPLLTVNQQASSKSDHRYIILNARTHPGQSSASWVLDGLLQEITQSQIVQCIIHQFNIVIKIIPMLNVQGVYIGNYRTGIMGVDFNRLFLSGSPQLFPEIEALRKMVQQCKKKGVVDLFLDFHGHSILPGCFIYGPEPTFAPHSQLKNLIKQLQRSKYFSKSNCVNGSDISKVETSRLYFQIQHGVYSLTLQNSLGLYNPYDRRNRQKQFLTKDWQQFGKDIIDLITNIYDEQNFHDNIQIDLSDQQIKVNFPDQQQFIWQKSKTDKGKIQKQLNKLNWLDLQQVDLMRSNITISGDKQQSDLQSLNDSDNQSQNLSVEKQQELIKAVKKKIQKNKSIIEHPLRTTSFNLKQQQSESRRMSLSSKAQCINNFKQYRFGFEDSTISDWYTRKRLLSIPKHLKNERKGQSYLIRKKNHRSVTEQQSMLQSIQATKRMPTEQKQTTIKPSYQKFSRENLVNKQKLLFDLLARK